MIICVRFKHAQIPQPCVIAIYTNMKVCGFRCRYMSSERVLSATWKNHL